MSAGRLLTEFGIDTTLRRQDFTRAARRALQDAPWRNSINLVEMFGKPKGAMRTTAKIGVQLPHSGEILATATIEAFLPPLAGR